MLAELVKSGSIERLQQYLSSPGVDINDRPGTDEALLDYAAEQNQAKVARFLIAHGARVYAVQTQGAFDDRRDGPHSGPLYARVVGVTGPPKRMDALLR